MNKKSKTASDQTIAKLMRANEKTHLRSILEAAHVIKSLNTKVLKDVEQIYIAACFVAGIYEGISGKPFRMPKNNKREKKS